METSIWGLQKGKKKFLLPQGPKGGGSWSQWWLWCSILDMLQLFFWAKPRFLHMFPPKNVMKTVPRADDPSTSTTQMLHVGQAILNLRRVLWLFGLLWLLWRLGFAASRHRILWKSDHKPRDFATYGNLTLVAYIRRWFSIKRWYSGSHDAFSGLIGLCITCHFLATTGSLPENPDLQWLALSRLLGRPFFPENVYSQLLHRRNSQGFPPNPCRFGTL